MVEWAKKLKAKAVLGGNSIILDRSQTDELIKEIESQNDLIISIGEWVHEQSKPNNGSIYNKCPVCRAHWAGAPRTQNSIFLIAG